MDNEDEMYDITYPAYVVTLKDASGLMLAGSGGKVFLPIFTDRDSAVTFGERVGMSPHPILEIPNVECLAILLENPPSRSKPFRADGIIFDPFPRGDGKPVNMTVYRSDFVIAMLKKAK